MGAFCVFGISLSDCKHIAENEVSALNIATDKIVTLTMDEWRMKVDVLAETIFNEEHRVQQISPEFDAPQFCRDWINVGINAGQIKSPVIMVCSPIGWSTYEQLQTRCP